MTNMQLYFAMGIPTFSILIGIVVGLFQLNQTNNQFNARFTEMMQRFTGIEGRMGSLELRLDARMAGIEADVKTIVRIFGEMDTRIARLEERISR